MKKNLTYTVYTGAKIVTMDPELPTAEAVCTAGGRIVCVGSADEAAAFVSGAPHTTVNLEGGALYPGFIDTHSHLSLYAAFQDAFFCDQAYGDIAAMLKALGDHAMRRPDREWVTGYCFDDTGMADQRHLTRHDLDSVCRDRPMMLSHITYHLGYVNTRAMELLGFDASTRIDGGEVHLGPDGQPSGLLTENAFFAAVRATPGETDEAALRAGLKKAVAAYNAQGFTTFQDGGIGLSAGSDELMRAYLALAGEGELNARAYLHFVPEMMDRLAPLGLFNVTVNDHLFLGGVKLFADGSIQSFTAALDAPYHTRPDFSGALVFPAEAIEESVLKYHRLGIPVAVHANGDKAIECVTRAFEKAAAVCAARVPGHMIVHAQMASDEHLARLKACGVTPTFFSRHVHVWGDRHRRLFLGDGRAARLDPAGTCVRLGMPFALHVDTPIQPVTALKSMHTAVNRRTSSGYLLGPEQRVSALEAVKAYTTYAAVCCRGKTDRGVIRPGFYADFTLLSEDPVAVPPETIEDIRVRMTICGGRVVYTA